MTAEPTASPTSPLRRTPLYERHRQLGARLVPFAGYEMPVQYPTGLVQEHLAVREAAGLFDVAHMGVLEVRGSGAHTFLNRALTRDLSKLTEGRAAYSILCREHGGSVDDLIVYREGPELFWVVLNASNKEKDLAYLRSLVKTGEAVALTPRFDDYALIALQGPKAFSILNGLGLETAGRKAFDFLPQARLAGFEVKVAFTGYTGESGVEIFARAADAAALWDKLLETGSSFGLKPAGLGARDTLRTEMGYSLYGHELEEDINPIEAGLAWAVGLKKENFVGKAALEEAARSPRRKLVGLKHSGKQAPRAGMRVLDSTGKAVGQITSGTFAPSLGHVIGLALVEAASQSPYSVDIRGTAVPFEDATRPFLKKSP